MAAELGSTRDPQALIPGNPEAIEDNARVLRTLGQAATDAGDGLRGVDTGAWGGPAANAFHDTFSYEPPKWHTVGDALTDAATALTGYADTLRWAQGQAAEAIRLWEAGQRATQQAQAQHNAAVEHANQQNQANAAAGNPNTVQVAPFTDPGEQQRQAARDLLQRARQQLTEAGDRTTEVLRGHTHNAPEGRDWLDELGSVAEGAWEGTQGILEFAWDHSPLRLVVDPKGFFEDKATLAQSLIGAVQNPVEFAKAAIDWDTWQNNPARAAGRLLPDALIAAATAGAGGAALKAGKTGSKAAEKAADVSKLGKDVKTVERKELSVDRKQIERKYDRHAHQFGVDEPRGRDGFEKLQQAMRDHVDDPGTLPIDGTYRNNPIILNYNPDTNLVVVQKHSGELVSGWKLGPQQVWNVTNRGSL